MKKICAAFLFICASVLLVLGGVFLKPTYSIAEQGDSLAASSAEVSEATSDPDAAYPDAANLGATDDDADYDAGFATDDPWARVDSSNNGIVTYATATATIYWYASETELIISSSSSVALPSGVTAWTKTGEFANPSTFTTSPPWASLNFTSIRFTGTVVPTTIQYWFYNLSKVTSIDFTNLDTSLANSCYRTFYGMTGLTTLDISNLNLAASTTFQQMFYGCTNLTKIITRKSSGTTPAKGTKGTVFTNMFQNCTNLEEVDMSIFTPTAATTLTTMFAGALKIKTIDLSGFTVTSTATLTNLYPTSATASNLTGSELTQITFHKSFASLITASTWNVPTVDVPWFYNDANTKFTTAAEVSTWMVSWFKSNTTKTSVTIMRPYTPKIYYSVTNGVLELSSNAISTTSFSSYTVTSASPFSSAASTATSVKFTGTVVPANMMYWFYNFTKLTSINFANLDAQYNTKLQYCFYNTGLASLDLTPLKCTNVANAQYMLAYNTLLKTANLKGMAFPSLTAAAHMFRNNSLLETLDVSGFTAAKIAGSVAYMFAENPKLQEVDLAGFNATGITNTSYMFNNDTGIKRINMPNLTGAITTVCYMFNECNSLEVLNIAAIVVSGVSWSATTTAAQNTYKLFMANMNNMKDMTISATLATGISYNRFTFGTNRDPSANNPWYRVTVTTAVESIDIASYRTNVYTTFKSMTTAGRYINTVNPTIYYGIDTAGNMTLSGYPRTESINGNFVGAIQANGSARWSAYVTSIKTVRFADKVSIGTGQGLFYGLTALETVDLTNLNTSCATSFANMFYGCTALLTANVSMLDFSGLTTVTGMFRQCTKLQSVTLGSINTTKVTIFSYMFEGDTSLTAISWGSLTTAAATNMSYMFQNCSSMTSLDLASFNTAKVTTFAYMFNGMSKLLYLNISSFSTSASGTTTGNYTNMMANCNCLQDLRISANIGTAFSNGCISTIGSATPATNNPWYKTTDTTSTVEKINKHSLARVEAIKSLNGAGRWITAATPMVYWGINSSTGVLTLSTTDRSTDAYSGSFTGGSTGARWNNATYINIVTSVIVDSPITLGTCASLFQNLSKLETVNLTNLDMSYAYSAASMFNGCTAVKNINFAGTTFQDSVAFNSMFYNCQALPTVNITTFNTAKSTTFNSMFYNCIALAELTITNFNTALATNMAAMFQNCSSLKELNCSSFNTAKVTTFANMFNGLTNLLVLNISSFSTTAAGTTAANYTTTFAGLTCLNDIRLSANFATRFQAKQWTTIGDSTPSTISPWYKTTDTTTPAANLDLHSVARVEAIASITTNAAARYVRAVTPMIYWGYDATSGALVISNEPRTEAAVGSFPGGLASNRWNAAPYNTGVKTVKVVGKVVIGTCASMFAGLTALTTADLTNLDTSYAYSAASMFNGCTALTSAIINTSDFRASVTFNSMFINCKALTGVDVSKLNTVAATNMASMFQNCTEMLSLDCSAFNTAKVTTFANMFNGLTNLVTLNISNFSTAAATTFTTMFAGLTYLGDFTISANIATKFAANTWTTIGSATPSASNPWFKTTNLTDPPASIDKSSLASITAVTGFNAAGRYITSSTGLVYWGINGSTGVLTFSASPRTGETYSGSFMGNSTGARWNSATYIALVKSVVVVDKIALGSCANLFQGLSNLVTVDLTNMDCTFASSAASMFYGCTSLVYINFAGANFQSATTFASMFYNCSSLEEVNTTTFNTAKATSFASMFYGCVKLKKLNLSNFTTTNSTTFASMFYNCQALEELLVTGWNTAKATGWTYMFYNCMSLKALDLSSFNTAAGTSFISVFQNCSMLNVLNVSNFSTAAVSSSYLKERHADMFNGCTNLQDLTISAALASRFSGGYVTTMGSSTPTAYNPWFITTDKTTPHAQISKYGLSQVTAIKNISAANRYIAAATPYVYWGLDAEGVMTLSTTERTEATRGVFHGGISTPVWGNANKTYIPLLKSVKVIDEISLTSGYLYFYNMTSLTSVDFAKVDMSHALNVQQMFDGCTALTDLVINRGTFQLATTFNCMFRNCKVLKNFDLSKFVTTAAVNMNCMFQNCAALTELDLKSFNTAKVTTIANMFNGCTMLELLDLSSFTTTAMTTFTTTFSAMNCLHDFRLSANMATKFAAGTWTTMGSATPTVNNAYYLVTDTTNKPEAIDKHSSTLKVTAIKGFTTAGRYVTAFNPTVYWGINGANGELVLSDTALTGYTYSGSFLGGSTGARWNSTTYINIVTSARVIGNISLGTCAQLFQGLSKLTTVNLAGLDTSYAYGANNMFYGCTALTNVILTNSDFRSAVSFANMFYNCTALQGVDVSTVVSPLVTTVASMFYNCSSLASIDISKFNTSTVTAFQYMFYGCKALTKLTGIELINTAKATNMSYMFMNCTSLPSLVITNFNTALVTTMAYMFSGMTGLKVLDISSFSTAKLTTFTSTFDNLNSLGDFKISANIATAFSGGKWSTIGALTPSNYSVWYSVGTLTTPIDQIDITKYTEVTAIKQFSAAGRYINIMTGTIYWGIQTATGVLTLSDTARSDTYNGSFAATVTGARWTSTTYINIVTSVRVEGRVAPGTLANWFQGLTRLVTADLTNMDTAGCRYLSSAFYGCTGLQTVNLKTLDTRHVTTTASMFYGCTALLEADLSTWETPALTTTANMFYNCTNLLHAYFNKWTTPLVTTFQYMFYNCQKLEALDLSMFTGPVLTNTRYMFQNCYAIKSIDLRNLNTPKVTLFTYMFYNCNNLRSLNIALLGLSATLGTDGFKYFMNYTNYLQDLTIGTYFANNISNSTVRGYLNYVRTPSVYNPWYYITDNNPDWTYEQIDCSKYKSAPVTAATGLNKAGRYVCPITTTVYWAVTNNELVLSADPNLTGTTKGNFLGSVTSAPNFSAQKANIKTVRVEGKIVLGSLYRYFLNFTVTESIDLTGVDSQYLSVAREAFSGCTKLTNLKIDSLDVSAVTNFLYMFNNCTAITEISIPHWITSAATTMSYMFYNCKALEKLDISQFNTSKVTDFSYMFYGLTVIKTLNVRHLTGTAATNTNYMFAYCQALESLDISGFVTTTKLIQFIGMFRNCIELRSLNVSNIVLSGATTAANRNYIFTALYQIKEIFISGNLAGLLKAGTITTFSYPTVNTPWYYDAKNSTMTVEELNAAPITTYKSFTAAGRYITDIDYYVYWALNGTDLTLSAHQHAGTKTGTVTVSGTFKSSPFSAIATSVNTVHVLDPIVVNSMAFWFNGFTKATTIDLTGIDSKYTTTIASMFVNCSSLTTLIINSLNVEKVTTFDYTFQNVSKLTSLNISNWKNSVATTAIYMFSGCSALEEVHFGQFGGNALTTMAYMFYNCKALRNADLSGFTQGLNCTTMAYMFYGCTALESVTLFSSYTNNTGVKLNTMAYMFYNCTSLLSVEFTNVYMMNVTTIAYMFYQCSSLLTVDFGAFTGAKLTTMQYLFYHCTSLLSLDLSKFAITFSMSSANYRYSLVSLDSLQQICLSQQFLTKHNTAAIMTNIGLNAIVSTAVPWYPLNGARNDSTKVTNPLNFVANTWYVNPFAMPIYWYVETVGEDTILKITGDALTGPNINKFVGSQAFASASAVPWYSYRNTVTEIQIFGTTIMPASTAYWFQNFTKLEKATNLTGLNTGSTTSVAYMFSGCSSLRDLDLTYMSMNSVTNYNYFLNGLSSILTITIGMDHIGMMAKYGFVMPLPMYHQVLGTVSTASGMIAVGTYYGGARITFTNGAGWNKVVSVGYGEKFDINSVDFSDMPVPNPNASTRTIYVAFDRWTYSNGTVVNFANDKFEGNVTIYGQFTYITFDLPSGNMVYDGATTHPVTINNSYYNIRDTITITYYFCPDRSNGTYNIVTSTIEAGYYYAKVAVGSKSVDSAKYQVTPIVLAVSGMQALSKDYDQTVNCTILADVIPNGVVAKDAGTFKLTASGHFEDPNVGMQKLVTVTDIVSNSYNYTIDIAGSQRQLAANIYQKDIGGATQVTGLKDMTYTGSELTQNLTLTVDGMSVRLNVDYILRYSNNTNAGVATIDILGMNNYTGIETIRFNINKKSINDGDVIGTIPAVTYTSLAITNIDLTVKYGTVTLVKNADYIITLFENNTNAGTAYVTIEGIGNNYTGSKRISFKINALSLADCELIFDGLKESYLYEGAAISPEFTLIANGLTLQLNTDYSNTYLNNTRPAIASVRVTGKGNYTGAVTKEYRIVALDFNDCTIFFDPPKVAYNGTSQKLIPTIIGKDGEVVSTSDYLLTYSSDTINAGEVSVTITGLNRYLYSEYIAKYEITPISIDPYSVGEIQSVVFNRREQTPTVVVSNETRTLVYGVDYTVEYTNNINVGTATVKVSGAGNYYGELYGSFTITSATITTATLKVKQVYYNGEAQLPSILTVIAGSFVLSEDEYDLVYLNADEERTPYKGSFVDAAEMIVRIVPKSGNNNYTGSAEVSYTIKPAILSNITLAASQIQFTGSEIMPEVLGVYASNGYVLNKDKNEYYLEYFRPDESGVYDETKQTTDFVNAGRIKIVAKTTSPNLTSTASFIFEIVKLNIQDPDVTIKYYFDDGSEERTYMTEDQYLPGKKVAPEVWYKDTLMSSEYFEYRIVKVSGSGSADDFTTVGSYYIIVTGVGSFTGSVTHAYKINPNEFTPEHIEVEVLVREFEYNGLPHTYDFESEQISVYDISDPDERIKLFLDVDFVLANGSVKVTGDDGVARTFNPVDGYVSNVNAGNAVLVLTGKEGQYSKDVIVVQFVITQRAITDADLTKIADLSYTAGYQEPEIELTIPATDETEAYKLVSGTDFKVGYENNRDVGTASVTITGINNFKGSISTSFKIVPKNIADPEITVNGLATVDYNGREQRPNVFVFYNVPGGNSQMLERSDAGDKDYILIFESEDFVYPGVTTVYLFGTGNYTGSLELTYTIDKLNITRIHLSDDVYVREYDGNHYDLLSKIVVTYGYWELQDDGNSQYVSGMAEKSGYILYYQVEDGEGWGEKLQLTDTVKIIDANRYRITIEATESGPYKASSDLQFIFEITGSTIQADWVQEPYTEEEDYLHTYTGAEITPEPLIKLPDGTVLRKDVDYTLSYRSNIDVGEYAMILITGKGSYKGTVVKYFTILQRDINEADIVIMNNEFPYDGLNHSLTDGDVYFKYRDVILKLGVDFRFTYKEDLRVAVATYQFMAVGMGNFKGSTTVEYDFSIVPCDLSTLDFGAVDPVTYTGKVLQPVFDLVDNLTNVKLEVGKDITFMYGDASTNLNVTWIVVDGKLVIDSRGIVIVQAAEGSNYTGLALINFAIAPVDLATDENVVIDPLTGTYVYNGAPIKVVPTVKFHDEVLEQYTFQYEFINADQAGTATVKVIAYERSNFINEREIQYTILDPEDRPDLANATVYPEFPDIPYDGLDHTPDFDSIKVMMNGEILVRGVDYEIEYSKMDGYFRTMGTKEFDIVAVRNGRFQGAKKITFRITGDNDVSLQMVYHDAEKGEVEINPEWVYNSLDASLIELRLKVGSGRTPRLSLFMEGAGDGEMLSLDGIKLVDGKYYLDGAVVKAAGLYAIRVMMDAQGDYEEYLGDFTFTITPLEITFEGIKAKDKVYDGSKEAVMDSTDLVLKGVLEGEEINLVASLEFEDENVAKDSSGSIIAKKVYINDIRFTGANAGNYTLAETGYQTETTATITPREIYVYLNIPSIVGEDGTEKNEFKIFVDLDEINYDIEGFSENTKQVFEITYTNTKTKEITYSMPQDVGTYEVEIKFRAGEENNFTLKDGSKTKDTFTLTAATLTAENIMPIADQEYTGAAITPDVIVVFGSRILEKDKDYSVTFTNNKNITTETSKAKATITGKGNYTGTVTVEFEIFKPALEIKNLRMEDWTYGGGAKAPTYDAPAYETYEIMYSAEPYADTEDGEDVYHFSTNVPTAVGNYFVRVRAKSTIGTEEEVFEIVDFKIVPKDLIADVDVKDYVYGEKVTAPKVTLTGIVGKDVVNYTLYYVCEDLRYFSTTPPTEVGTYTILLEIDNPNYKIVYRVKDVTVEGEGDGEDEEKEDVPAPTAYEDEFTETSNVTFTIAPLRAKAVVEIADWMYGDPASTPELFLVNENGDTVEGVEVTYSFVYSDKEDGDYTDQVPTLPGTYFIKAVIQASVSYELTVEVTSFEITRRVITVTRVSAANKVYDGNSDAEVTIEEMTGILEKDDVTVTAKGKFTDKNVSRSKLVTAYGFEISGEQAEYYVMADESSNKVNASAAISARELTVTLKGVKTFTYLDTPTFELEIEGLVEGDTDVVVLRYQNMDGDVFNSLVSLDAGGYTAYVELLNSNYILSSEPKQSFDIEPLKITEDMVKNIPIQPFEGEAIEPVVTLTAKGYTLVLGKDYTVMYSDNDQPGTAKVLILADGNFTGTLEIEFRILDISVFIDVEGYHGEYDGKEHDAFATHAATDKNGEPAEGVTWEFTYDGKTYTNYDELPLFKDVGEYEVFYKVTDQYGKSAEGSVIVKITAAQIRDVEINGYEGEYDGAEHMAADSMSCTSAADTPVTWWYSTDEGDDKTYTNSMPSFKEIGEYTVYYKITAPNHEDYYGSFTVKITKAVVTGEWVETVPRPTFRTENPKHSSQLEYTYFDEEGNEVKQEDLVPGKKYKAKVSLKDSENYEFQGEDEFEFTMATDVTLFEVIEENKTFKFYDRALEEIEDYSEHMYDAESPIYLTNIAAKDTLADIIAQFKNSGIRAFNSEGEEIEDLSTAIATGMQLRLYDGETIVDALTLAVKGDLDGDGVVSANDRTLTTNHMSDVITLEGAYRLAADVDGDGGVSANDRTLITNHMSAVYDIFDGLSVHKESAASEA